MGLGSFVCAACHKRSTGPRRSSPTGRVVCENCYTSLLGVAAAQAAGQNLPETVATVGWLQRIRAARGKRRWPGEGE